VADSLDTLDLARRRGKISAGHKQMIQKTLKERKYKLSHVRPTETTTEIFNLYYIKTCGK